MAEIKRIHKNLFEIDNARNLSRDELVATFVPIKAFERLLSAKNHIVLGSRGSGKTALAKILSHDHLSKLNDSLASDAVRTKAFIGIYVPTKLEWVGGLKNKPWQTEREKEEFFQWRLNLSTCMAFLNTLRSCLDSYVTNVGQRAKAEAELINQIGKSWLDETFSNSNIRELYNSLEDLDHKKELQLARIRALGGLSKDEKPVGINFDVPLFSPLRRAMSLTTRILDFPKSTIWLLCLDEAEFLEELHHRILNSHLRAHSGNLFFKITTMPYCHYTLETNTGVPLNVGHDFEYIYIDHDPVTQSGQNGEEGHTFAGEIFNKRASLSGRKYQGVSLRELLGPSLLLNPKLDKNWGSQSQIIPLLEKYANETTKKRAKELYYSRSDFMDQIARKMHGALLLRNSVANLKGRAELNIYSGDAMVIRCGDANPRRLIGIFNRLLLEAKWNHQQGYTSVIRLRPNVQTKILTAFSSSTLARVQSEPGCGPQLYEFLEILGNYMHQALHNEAMTTDQISSIYIDRDVPTLYWGLIQRAVGLGLLFPNVNANNPDEMPEREGTFHLAYVLAPKFRILPRRGKARKLNTILKRTHYLKIPSKMSELEELEHQIKFEFFGRGNQE